MGGRYLGVVLVAPGCLGTPGVTLWFQSRTLPLRRRRDPPAGEPFYQVITMEMPHYDCIRLFRRSPASRALLGRHLSGLRMETRIVGPSAPPAKARQSHADEYVNAWGRSRRALRSPLDAADVAAFKTAVAVSFGERSRLMTRLPNMRDETVGGQPRRLRPLPRRIGAASRGASVRCSFRAWRAARELARRRHGRGGGCRDRPEVPSVANLRGYRGAAGAVSGQRRRLGRLPGVTEATPVA